MGGVEPVKCVFEDLAVFALFAVIETDGDH